MTDIRTARAAELPRLTTLDGQGERNDATAAYLTDLLAKGCTRPEWCFVAEDGDGKLIGNIVLWSRPGGEVPSDFVLFEAPWNDRELALRILRHGFAAAKGLGAEKIGHVLDGPAQGPQWQFEPETRVSLYTEAGLRPARDGRRFQWLAGSELPAQDPRLTWRSLSELGEKPFVDLLERILADTADSLLLEDVAELGLRGAAELILKDMSDMEHEPEWFELGYDESGDVAVVSLPARNPSYPVIGFVGVSPGHRGKGYSASVVARGTQILIANGATEIRGDCDAGNVAMYKGFESAGYVNFASRREFSGAI
ncbi:mycothiol acetyltransferase [Phytomonospora sp. NPDC050363]|uniref:GNAT family N-acetyltransferase n=1 Tax=Phytomonospora sp. NPDC050363 TaxID=3155642 RepID=UPI00340EB01D